MDEPADEIRPNLSYVSWVISSLGWPTIGLMFVVASFSLVMIWFLYRRGKEPSRDVAILLLIILPLLVGSALLLGGAIVCLNQIALGKTFVDFGDALVFTLNMAELTAVTFIPVLLWGATALVLLSKQDDARETGERRSSL